MNAGPKELNEGFVRSLPDNGPVVMVNLLRFKKESADGNGSGWDAYSRYSKAIQPLIKGVEGAILWAGDIEGAAYGDLNAKHWDRTVDDDGMGTRGRGALPYSGRNFCRTQFRQEHPPWCSTFSGAETVCQRRTDWSQRIPYG